MKAAAILALCLVLQGCYGWAHRYVAEHPDGMSGVIYNTGCCCEGRP